MRSQNGSQKRTFPSFHWLVLDDLKDSRKWPVNGDGAVTSCLTITTRMFSCQNFASLARALSACCLTRWATNNMVVDDLMRWWTISCLNLWVSASFYMFLSND